MIPTSTTFIPLFQMLATLGPVDTYLGVSLAQATWLVPLAVLRTTVIVTTAIVLAAQGPLRRGLTLGAVR